LLVDEYDAFGNDYLEPNRPTWEGSSVESVFKSFWAEVKSLLIKHGIQRSFITGISPLSLTDIVSGFNVAKNISFNEKVSGLCGLTRSDVEAALKKVCGPEDYKEHLRSMVEYCNGFYFCRSRNGETVFNTETCLDHLQVRIDQGYSHYDFRFLTEMDVIAGYPQWKYPLLRRSSELRSV